MGLCAARIAVLAIKRAAVQEESGLLLVLLSSTPNLPAKWPA